MISSDVDSCVAVYPFTRQPKGDEIVIGRRDTRTFLALPPDAIEILDFLATGKTVREAGLFYQQRYGEILDLESFLKDLAERGFVCALPKSIGNATPDAFDWATHVPPDRRVRRHFSRFPEAWARRIFSPAFFVVGALAILGALIALCVDPTILPRRDALFFQEDRSLSLLLLVAFSYTTLFLHEMAHLVAARALGLDASMGIGHRLYVLVAETDLTALWSVPKRQRYVPILAGPWLDLVSASALILLLFATDRHFMTLSSFVYHLGKAMILLYLLRLLWQCYFFLRTDFYYAIITALDCSNLMQDTETFLYNRLSRVLPFLQRRNESLLPSAEARAVYAYAPVWLLGRAAALWVLAFVGLPVTIKYAMAVWHGLQAGYAADPLAFIDSLVLACVALVPSVIGLSLWIRSLIPNTRRIEA
jgi:hypothetical protein